MADYADFYNQRIGTTLRGKWKIERLLGVGGMAAVYVAVHTIGHRVAVKILHPEVAASQELRDRFELEAHAVNRFSHPGAVAITDTDIAEDGCPFLVMELLEGESLQDKLEREGHLQTDEVLRLADELLDVLAAAHSHGIVHRDIKPDNLFVLNNGRLKVLDFGIARMKEGAPRPLHTRTGMAMGTITYMPPEQVRGQHVDGRADIFAVAATMFRLLTGRRIHEAESHADMLVKMASVPAPPLSSVDAQLPDGICQIVDCGLAFRREDRYPDALSMQADVRAVRQHKIPPFAAARAESIALQPTVPSTVAGVVTAGAATGVTADGPTRAEPHGSATRAASASSPPASHKPAAPLVDPTAPMTVPDAAPPPVSAPRAAPATWVSASPPSSVPAASAVVPAVQIVPTPGAMNRKSRLPLVVVLASVALIVLGTSLALGIRFLTAQSAPASSSSAAETQVDDPMQPSADPATLNTAGAAASHPPIKGPGSGGSKSPPNPTATTVAVPPIGTMIGGPPATTGVVPPGNTGKPPPGQDKDKGKKHH